MTRGWGGWERPRGAEKLTGECPGEARWQRQAPWRARGAGRGSGAVPVEAALRRRVTSSSGVVFLWLSSGAGDGSCRASPGERACRGPRCAAGAGKGVWQGNRLLPGAGQGN